MSNSTIRRMWVVVVMVLGMLALAAPAAWAADFTVTNTNDGGNGSYRQAILDANATPNGPLGPDAIKFKIPTSDAGYDQNTGVYTISPTSYLPIITEAVTIDGYTQQGAKKNTLAQGNDAKPVIELDGTNAGYYSGVALYASNSTIRGLVINRFNEAGIVIYPGTSGNVVEGNFIGTNADGTTVPTSRPLPNGVAIDGSSNNTIGGTSPEARNVVSGIANDGVSGISGNGVYIGGNNATGNKVEGNYIGTNATGTTALANETGVFIDRAPNNTVGGTAPGARNVISGNSKDGVILASSSNVFAGNYVGTDATGTKDLGNSRYGVWVREPNNTIGGTTSGARNIISGNEDQAVYIYGSDTSGNKVEGNYIGTDATGQENLGNSKSGVYVEAPNNTVGGTASGAGNIISASANFGVVLASSGNKVEGNYVGTDATGQEDLGNSDHGVLVFGPNNTIGGTTSGARNIISGNGKPLNPENPHDGAHGVLIAGGDADGNEVEGNYVGTDATGQKDVGNSGIGVAVLDGDNNTIGGTASGAPNVMAFNSRDGVVVVSPSGTNTGNAILSNSIFSNGHLGIDLGVARGYDDGFSANDPGDTDSGPNDLQNFPELSSANLSNGTTTIEGTLDSTPGSTFTIQFFSSPEKDPSGHGEGKEYLDQQSVSTDSSGKGDFSFTTQDVSAGEFVSATATDSNSSTSEFSNAVIVNAVPQASSQSVTTGEDEAKTIILSATDAEGEELTFEITDQPDHGSLGSIGTVRCEAAAKSCEVGLTYTPDKEYSGPDSFDYTVSDGESDSNAANVSITVEAVNDAPEATDESYNVDEEKTLNVPDGATDLLANDSDVEGDTLTAVPVQSPAHGQLALSPDGSFTYTPDEDYYGTDSFTYKATDGNLDSNVVTVTITVNPLNDKPVGTTDILETPENTPLVLTQEELTNNDGTGAPNEGSQSLTITDVSDPQHGQVSLDKDKAEITFTPDAGYNGKEASFLYTLCDDGEPQECSVEKVMVNVTVTEVNDQPVATADSISLSEDGEKIFDPLSNDSTGPENESEQTLTVDSIASQPTHGTATLITSGADSGKVSYKPDADYFGSDSFTYKVCDDGTTKGEPDSKCDLGTVSVSVNPANDIPVAKPDTQSTPENTPLVLSVNDLTANDEAGAVNESGQTLTVTEVTNPLHGTVSLQDGKITFTPEANYNGPATFEYTVCDDGEPQRECSTQTATVNVTVSPVNSRPEATDASFTMDEDAAPLTIDFSKLVSDVETADANLTYNIGSVKPNQGTLSGTGQMRTFDSADNFNGTLTISYTVTDRGDPDNCSATTGGGDACEAAQTSEQKTVSITVAPVNDAPVAKDDSYRLEEDTKLEVPLSSGVLKNDSDVDADNRLSATTLQEPKHGTLTLRASGSFVYRPAKDYSGSDQFTYTLSDGEGGKDTATVLLRVASAPEPPNDEEYGCTITGTPGDDELRGTQRADVICGLGGDDAISGLGGDDILRGGPGDDDLKGGSGADRLFGENGVDALDAKDNVSTNDAMNGGGGIDSCRGERGDTKTDCEPR